MRLLLILILAATLSQASPLTKVTKLLNNIVKQLAQHNNPVHRAVQPKLHQAVLPKKSGVYAMSSNEAPEVVKFGVSSNPKRRLAQLQTGNAHTLHIREYVPTTTTAQAFKAERVLHSQHKQIRGEWYSTSAYN